MEKISHLIHFSMLQFKVTVLICVAIWFAIKMYRQSYFGTFKSHSSVHMIHMVTKITSPVCTSPPDISILPPITNGSSFIFDTAKMSQIKN
jgi:hypothetical protein